MTKKSDLGYYWTALFTNIPKKVDQFDDEEVEVPWSYVEGRMADLEELEITNGGKKFSADLLHQELKTPSGKYDVLGANPELIYFRRNVVRMDIGEVRPLLAPIVYHHVGIKTDDNADKFMIFNGMEMKPHKEYVEIDGEVIDITTE